MTEETGETHINASGQKRSEDSQDAGQRYRFEHLALRLVLGDMYFSKDDPGPGDRVPDFDLPTLGGGRFRSTDLGETAPLLLIFGSYTCPVTDSAAPGLRQLHARFGDRVRFVMVDVREAHPGKAVPQPKTLEEKTAHAEQLRDGHSFKFEVAVDDIDGTFHRAMSPKPNSAYLLGKDGTILFRAQWANDTKALAAALEAASDSEPLTRSQSGGLVLPMLRLLRDVAPVLDRAGSGAWGDMWRAAPPMAATAFALKTLRVRPPKPDDREG
jgi:thiol-disulfide isomerase/thioredoxin